MASFESCKLSSEAEVGGEVVGCAAAMLEKENESFPSACETSSSSSSSSSSAPLQGYDVEFDPPLERKYECPICLMALRNAMQTRCGHRFCKSCIEKSIRDAGQRCPVDNETLSEEQLFPDNFAKREILSLTVRCPNPGCTHKMELRSLEAHRAQCEFSCVPCPQCEQDVRKTLLQQHTELECPRRPLTCPECVASYVFEDKELHEQQCPFANVKCQYCELDLIREQIDSHCDTDCPRAPIACNFSMFGCKERMQRQNLAQHMQEFTQMHMRFMADFLRGLSLNGSAPKPPRMLTSSVSCDDAGIRAAAAASSAGASYGGGCCSPAGPSVDDAQRLREMDARLVKQDHQLRELIILKDTQTGQLAELRQKVSVLEENLRDLQAQQCHGVFIWQLRGFSAHMRLQEAGQPVVEHSPGFYTGHPGYKLCLRLHLQTANAQRCSNFISLFVHTMQGAFDQQLSWPFQGTIRLAVLDQGADPRHHMEVMETKPDLLAFQKPSLSRNPKGFGYVTFMHLTQLAQRGYVKNDTLLIRCEVTPRFDLGLQPRDVQAVLPRGPVTATEQKQVTHTEKKL